jgi:putative ABC transport system substrate-binding protein
VKQQNKFGMRRRDLVVAAGILGLRPTASFAQREKVPVIGVLVSGSPNPEFALSEFRLGLRELGYEEGRTIRVEIRSAEGDLERLPKLAVELVAQKVDVIAAWLTPVVLAAKAATTEIPIVMIGAADPVGTGIVASLSRPGGNVSGIAGLTADLAGKQVEFLKEMLPGLSRIAVLCNRPDPFSTRFLEQIQAVGKAQAVEIVPVMINAGSELDAAFREVTDKKTGALIVQPSLPLRRAAELALTNRIPAASPLTPFPADGGLLAYAGNEADGYRRAALFVDKILKGAKPPDLPVEQPTKFKLIVNLKAAKAIGLTVPPGFLIRADQIIE